MIKILLATGNKHKVEELLKILPRCRIILIFRLKTARILKIRAVLL